MTTENISQEQVQTPDEDSFGAIWDDDSAAAGQPAGQPGVDDGGGGGAAAPAKAPEPAGADDTTPAGQPAPAQAVEQTAGPDPEEERRLNAERSMQGRLDAERRRREELENELRALRARTAEPAPKPQHATPDAVDITALVGDAIPASSVDEDTRNMIVEFAKNNPSLGRLLIEDSDAGKDLRKVLSEYGSEHTATVARLEVTRRQVQHREHVRAQESQREAMARHYSTLASDHPEFADALTGDTDEARAKAEHLGQDFRLWINHLPYHKALVVEKAMQTNDTVALSRALGEFKRDLQEVLKMHEEKSRSSAAQADRARAANAGAAVVTRGGAALPVSQPNKDDFDAAWDES